LANYDSTISEYEGCNYPLICTGNISFGSASLYQFGFHGNNGAKPNFSVVGLINV
jgi:hypothetical protein